MKAHMMGQGAAACVIAAVLGLSAYPAAAQQADERGAEVLAPQAPAAPVDTTLSPATPSGPAPADAASRAGNTADSGSDSPQTR